MCSARWPGSLVICSRQSCVSLEPATCILSREKANPAPLPRCYRYLSVVLAGSILTAAPSLAMPAAAFFAYLPPLPHPRWAGSPEHFRGQPPSTDYILAFLWPGEREEIACSQLEGSWLWAQQHFRVLAQALAQRSPQQMASVEDTSRLSGSHGHLWEGLRETEAQATS